ncbi:MAG: hypothetical protein LBG57_09145, partial [Treponema sp.]|nr:hypothetical protein [Treponema sp.]
GDQTYTWYQGEYYPDVLTNGTPYTFTVTTRDINGNLGAAITIGSTPHEGTLAQRIAAASSGDTITLYKDEAVPAAIGINKTITLIGYDDTERTLIIDGYSGAMFNVAAGGSLTLDEYVTLRGKSGNNASVVTVNGGSLVMKDGSKITGNANTANSLAGGVQVNSGMFIMKGGTISDNKGSYASPWRGGGVQVNGGTFKMEGGIISRNSTPGSGGGVGVQNGTFIKSDTTDSDSGTIYGMDGGADKNIMNSDGGGSDNGYAVFYQNRYRNTTLGPSDDISTATLTSPPWNQ